LPLLPSVDQTIKRFKSEDGFEENTYVLCENAGRECIVIDPGATAEEVIAYVDRGGLRVKLILATHAHVDHVVSAPLLAERLGSRFLVNRADSGLLSTVAEQATAFGYPFTGEIKADGFFDEGSVFGLGALSIEVLHTPGHTPGSSCFLVNRRTLFTGDTLFAGSIGRTDFPGGSPRQMGSSLKRLAALPDPTIILPGHEGESTIGDEKASNPFLLSGDLR
jgi:glyoxylase-like metal-dependent hydrolase (beta-lactamase superfamily II)